METLEDAYTNAVKEIKALNEQLAKANKENLKLNAELKRESMELRSRLGAALGRNSEYNEVIENMQQQLAKANERVEHLEQCISVYHSGIVDMFPHPSVTDGTFFVPIEKYNSMVTKLTELSSRQEQVLANNHSSCELESGAYGTYCKCQDEQLRKEQASEQ